MFKIDSSKYYSTGLGFIQKYKKFSSQTTSPLFLFYIYIYIYTELSLADILKLLVPVWITRRRKNNCLSVFYYFHLQLNIISLHLNSRSIECPCEFKLVEQFEI